MEAGRSQFIMTPNKKSFYAGTYFPKDDRSGMPGLTTILKRITEIWREDRSTLVESGEQIKDSGESTLPGKESEFIEESRKRLFDYREKRVHPYREMLQS